MERILAQTRALCPTCLRVVPGTTVESGGKVYLNRSCPEHGGFSSLVLSDATWWEWSRRFIRPGRRPAHTATETVHGGPYDCGFCPEHQQHACVTVFEITEACNLECPACFAGEAHVRHAGLEEIEVMADALVRAEGGQADVAMLSGGEPTLHPRFFEVADAIRSRPIRYVIVNSNGIRMARDPAFCRGLAERDMLVYLQFDGFSDETYRTLRGRPDLYQLKRQALANLAKAGVRVVLVATVLRGVNDHEIGAIVRYGAEHPAVRAVSFQPQFGEGRFVPFDGDDRMTITDVIDAIARDSGVFTREDFTPVPCCDPMCTAATFAYAHDGRLIPISRLVPVESVLDYGTNSAMPHLSEAFRSDLEEMREVLLKLYSKSAPAGSDRQAEAFFCACEPLLAEMSGVEDLPDRIFGVTIEGFMDRQTFDLSRAVRCCIQEALPDGRIVPFCVYNTLYRFAPDHRPAPPGPVTA